MFITHKKPWCFISKVMGIRFSEQLTGCAAAAKSLQSCPTLCDPIDGSPPGSPVPGILQARTLEWVAISFSWQGVGYENLFNNLIRIHSLLQGIFLTQGLNLGFLHCRQILYRLSHQGSPRILEWVAFSFSRGSFWSRNQTGVLCVTGGFFTSWATREAQFIYIYIYIYIYIVAVV